MGLERLADRVCQVEPEIADLQDRTPVRLIAATLTQRAAQGAVEIGAIGGSAPDVRRAKAVDRLIPSKTFLLQRFW